MFPTPTTCPTQLKCVQARSREEGAERGLRGTLHAGLAPRGHLPPLRAMVCDDGSHASSPHVRRKSLRRLASTRGFKPRASNDYGWIRVFEGLEPFSIDAPSKLVKVALNTTVEDINKKLGFTDELTLWMQTGGENSRRLELDEFPLRIQEQFLATCGWKSEARRLRLAVDPELRHSLRWCVGPAAREDSVLRSGTLYILKGHVFPQWKPRPAYVIGSRLHTYGAAWEPVELSGGSIELCPPKAQRLVLCVKPHCQGSTGDTGTNHIFLGFSTIWERNLWFCWLKEATQSTQPPNVLDLSGGGRASLGAALAQHSAGAFTIRVLRLKGSSLATLPLQTWTLQALTHLDISENRISNLPAEICQLTQLEELQVSDNELRSLEVVLRLPRLRILVAARNLISTFGASNIAQMTHNILDEENKTEHRAPLTTVDLRHNRLKGSIILGNYEHLVSLDVSHNLVEVLVVSSLRGLRELYAAHNSLQHLALHGASLRTLRAPHNQLETLTTTVPPINLVEVNLSHNKLTALPQWLSGCSDLTTLHASNNQLTSLPDHLFCSELSSLSNVHLAHNKISSIPSMPRLRAPLKELLLHDNCIQQLPENFFSVCDRLCILNLSNNRLSRLPNTRGPSHCLERLYLTANCLTDDVADVIVAFRNLKILHIAYNCLTNLPESCINFWPDIEELVLSGNALSRLPETLPQLNNIRILRAHSNRLRSVPMFACSASVKILDFAHNELDSIDLRLLAPKQLKFLDISCNKKLQVDPTQFNSYRCQRPLSLVDVTGRHTLPWTQRSGYHEELNGSSPWSTGFSECPNSSLQLCCAQIRLPSFCNKEGLFAIIDGENDTEVPKILQTCLPGLLLEEKSIKETVNEYMKYVVLSAHRELKEKGQRNGACLIMCHLSPINTSENGFGNAPKRYSLKLANVGDTKAVLSRRNGPLSLGIENNKRLGYSSRYPNTVPDPDVIQTIIKEDDEFLILGNGHFWNAISMDTAVSEVRAERNPVLAAKRLQDLAQSYGVEECISVMIIRFDAIKSDVDLLMRELRQTISTTKSVCRSDCCCSRLEPCCHSSTPPKSCSDRSSPSGQSDRPLSEAINHQHYASVRSQAKASERRSCRGGVARAIRVRVEEDKEEDSRNEELPNSEEQFKCWEYMLEQNTQMLFDKELDNLSKGIKSNVSSLRNIKGLSGSSPQLHLTGKQSKGVPFLSKHFGSARSFGNNLKPDLRFGSGRVPIGGPNAAYFGSLQRLMPYHLEYDFAVIQEKSAHSQDSLDLEGRMQQYWGVATTEL